MSALRRALRRSSSESDSWLFTPWYYNVQAGTDLADDAAYDDYVTRGREQGLLPNPLQDFEAAPPGPELSRSTPVRAELLDDVALIRLAPGAADHPGGLVGWFLEQASLGRAPAEVRGRAWPDFMAHRRRQGRWVGQILDSGLFDRAYYELQTRTFAGERAAVWHYVETGEPAGLSPHPLFEPALYRLGSGNPRSGAFAHFIRSGEALPSHGGATPEQVTAAATKAAKVYGEQSRLTREPPRPVARWLVDSEPPAQGSGSVSILCDARAWGDPAEVLAQTHADWQLVVYGDSPSDLPDDPRIVVASSANEAVAVATGEWVTTWTARQAWSPGTLASLLSAGDEAVGEVVVGEEWLGPFRADEGALWRRPRSLAGLLLRRSTFGETPFRAEAGEVYEWDFLLRSGVAPTYVPHVVARLEAEDVWTRGPGYANTDEHVLRARSLIDWDQVRVEPRVSGRASLLIPVFRDWRLTRKAIDAALANGDGDIEVVAVDNGSARDVTGILASSYAEDPRVHVHRLPVNTNFATGSNVAFARSTGELAVFLNNDTEPRAGWLAPLRDAVAREGVLGAQPLLLYPDDTIQTAGTIFFGPGAIAGHLLASFPREDLRPEIDLTFDAVTAACMAVPAAMVAEAEGFDPAYANGMEDVDLCLRLVERHGGHFVCDPSSVVVHHESKSPGRFARSEANRLRFLDEWGTRLPASQADRYEQAGFEVTGLLPSKALPKSGRRTAIEPQLRRPPRVTEAGIPCLRWALKIAAWGGARGDGYGDVAFARDLADGLRALGQEVVVDRIDAHVRASDHLDDVTLTVRGLVPTVPQPGATNVLWVISHPEDVPALELSGYDLVYAAAPDWHGARPLLQATRMSPDGPTAEGLGTLFVGRTRKVFRPIVRDALEAKADLSLFGDGWEEFLDPSLVRADHLDNADLPAAYRGARVVLNDHWADMAELGFLSNRLFDAVACGARVVSDHVPGIELLGPSVQVYRSVDDLRELLAPDSTRWAPDEELRANALRVAAEHSFEARARVLLDDVLAARLDQR